MRQSLWVLVALVGLAGCAPVPIPVWQPAPFSQWYPQANETRPATVEPVWFPDPPVETHLSKLRGNGRYLVAASSFTTWSNVHAYMADGIAFWRNERFDDRQALSGESFDNNSLVAAHRYLPLPSFVLVTNLDNGVETIVRVNDRGPFRAEGLIDLSRAAAMKLGFGNARSRPVRIKLLDTMNPNYVLETNYMYGRDTALDVVNRLKAINLGHLNVMVIPHQYENRYRVRISPFGTLTDANYVVDWLSINLQLTSTLLKE
ncbi:MAG: septal ring lytic transglycosylase RlpA family protein [Gammaproteobacteria bacterium]|nr:septal ring lytic transglycosylase RlpA family protein [Gammaproteobacteria bacterium]